MPALTRTSLRSHSRIGQFQLSARRRAALHTTLRKFEAANSTAHPGTASHLPGLGFPLWMPLLLPVILVFLAVLGVVRVFNSAVRWIVIWCGGFLAGGLLAWCLNALAGGRYSAEVAVAAGGFMGLVVLSAFYGMCLEWVFWLSRHESNPYARTVSLSPKQEADRVAFAKSLHWPTALASACGGFAFAASLFPIIAGTETQWPSIAGWALLGALGLSVQGLLLGLFLGAKRTRVVYDASNHSLGEFVGWHLAGSNQGLKPAVGWGLGYALHQLPAGVLAGAALGGMTHLVF